MLEKITLKCLQKSYPRQINVLGCKSEKQTGKSHGCGLRSKSLTRQINSGKKKKINLKKYKRTGENQEHKTCSM